MINNDRFSISLDSEDVFEKKYILSFQHDLPEIDNLVEMPKIKKIMGSGNNHYFSKDKDNSLNLVLTIYTNRSIHQN